MFASILKDARALMLAVIGLVAGFLPSSASAQQVISQGVPKQVDLVVEGNRLVASNVRLSRFDEHRLNAQERIADTQVGNAVIVVVTNQNIIAYGVVSGWRSVSRIPNERIDRVSAEDFGALVVTSERMLNFNGESGTWGERKRRAGR